MPVWRVTINKVKAERLPSTTEGMTVEVKPSLRNAEVEKAGNAELIKVEYVLNADYKPGIGQIEIGGHIYFLGLDPKKVMKDNTIIDPDIVRQAYQRIFVEPMVLAINLAKDLTLPLPVRMPEITVDASAVGKSPKAGKASKKK